MTNDSTLNKEVEREEDGRYKGQGEFKFNSEKATEVSNEHAWSNRRKEILKRFGKWDDEKENSNDE